MTVKVCHITTTHPALDHRIFHKECKTLVEAGYQVSLIAPNTITETQEGIRVIGLRSRYSMRWLKMMVFPWKVYQMALKVNADIYHFHDPDFLVWAPFLVKKGKMVIYDAHEDLPRQILEKHYIPRIFRRFISRMAERIENKVTANLTHIVAATEPIRDRFLPMTPRVTAIRNFPKLTEFNPPPDWGKRISQVIYVGAIAKVRGAVEMVNLADKINIPLVLAGNFNPPGLQDELNHISGWKNTTYLGVLNRKEVETELNKSRIGLAILHKLANYEDALPVKLFEYMAAGLPVIITNIPLWKRIVEENQCGIAVDPYNGEEVAKAVHELLDNDKRAAEMGANGRMAVEQIFNWEREAQKLLELYDSLSKRL